MENMFQSLAKSVDEQLDKVEDEISLLKKQWKAKQRERDKLRRVKKALTDDSSGTQDANCSNKREVVDILVSLLKEHNGSLSLEELKKQARLKLTREYGRSTKVFGVLFGHAVRDARFKLTETGECCLAPRGTTTRRGSEQSEMTRAPEGQRGAI